MLRNRQPTRRLRQLQRNRFCRSCPRCLACQSSCDWTKSVACGGCHFGRASEEVLAFRLPGGGDFFESITIEALRQPISLIPQKALKLCRLKQDAWTAETRPIHPLRSNI